MVKGVQLLNKHKVNHNKAVQQVPIAERTTNKHNRQLNPQQKKLEVLTPHRNLANRINPQLKLLAQEIQIRNRSNLKLVHLFYLIRQQNIFGYQSLKCRNYKFS